MRCNVGVDPKLLVDQHLIAESVELKMVTGMMRYRIDKGQQFGQSPDTFRLAKGHILFFTDKLAYLARRLAYINEEMRARGFKPGAPDFIDPNEFGSVYNHDWTPEQVDSDLIKERLVEKIQAKPSGFWRLRKKSLFNNDLEEVLNSIRNSSVYYV